MKNLLVGLWLAVSLVGVACSHQKTNEMLARDFCDSSYACVNQKLDTFIVAAGNDPRMSKTSAKVVDFLCADGQVKVALSVDVTMDISQAASPPDRKNCIVARVLLSGVLNYFPATNSCTIKVVTSNFQNIGYCAPPTTSL